MNLSAHGAEIISQFEGFRARPYKDAAGVWTVGYGSTRGVGPDTPRVSRAQAMARLRFEVDEVYGHAVNQLRLPLSQGRFDALVSFVYNVGPGAVAASTGVGEALRAQRWRTVERELLKWDKAVVGGRLVRLPGLTRRRRVEVALFREADGDALEGYTVAERRWIREYDELVRGDRDPERRRVLRGVMRAQRKRVWRAAQGGGWEASNRRARYASLLARSG